MNLPRILIASTESGKANEIAASIGGERLPEDDDRVFEYYLWNIRNKYYVAQVLICTTEKPATDIPVDDVQALIVHHDPLTENAEERLKEWSPLINSLAEAEVLLFSCNFITDSAARNAVTKWCLQNRFELVELNKPEDPDDLEAENNKYGIDRIVEALHAHVWSNMILKSGTSSEPEKQSVDVNEVGEKFENIVLSQRSTAETSPMENMLDGIMGEENADFGELFGQLRAMKEHAAMLPTDQRRIAAEQLVTAFWKAMGGDPSEMED